MSIHHISARCVQWIRRYIKRCGHEQCRCNSLLACIECIASWSITTHQISAQCVQPFLRYGKGLRTCRYRYPIHDLYNTHNYIVGRSTRIPNFSAMHSVGPEIRKRAHLHVCNCLGPHTWPVPTHDLCDVQRYLAFI